MWFVFLIVIWLSTQIILNTLKIFDYIEMMITSKQTAKLIQNDLDKKFEGVKRNGI